jgi:hypothetical protein
MDCRELDSTFSLRPEVKAERDRKLEKKRLLTLVYDNNFKQRKIDELPPELQAKIHELRAARFAEREAKRNSRRVLEEYQAAKVKALAEMATLEPSRSLTSRHYPEPVTGGSGCQCWDSVAAKLSPWSQDDPHPGFV